MDKEYFERNLQESGNDFCKYGKIYSCTNENLKCYIPDLTDKKVLTVSASGDHLLNCIGMGAKHVDTFDVNNYSPLFQSLKIHAIKHLSSEEALDFIRTLRFDLYLKFKNKLPESVRNFFDFLYHNYSLKQIKYQLFHECDVAPSKFNNYFNIETLKYIRDNLKKVKHKHYSVNLSSLDSVLDTNYDAIFLSNISHYINPESLMSYLTTLYNEYLNDGGEMYFAYIHNTHGIKNPIDGLLHVSDKYKFNKQTRDFSKKVEVRNFSNDEYSNCKDAVLVLKK